LARDLGRAAAGIAAVAIVTFVYVGVLEVANATTVALTFLLIVLIVAATSRLWTAVATSVVAMLLFNFFFLPPVRTLTIADPQNWVALFAFLAVSLVASNLSSVARARARDAVARGDELSRLFDLSRDVLLMTEGRDALSLLARFVARRFELDYVAVCLPHDGGWDISEGGNQEMALDRSELSRLFAATTSSRESDAGHTRDDAQTMIVDGQTVIAVPLRLGTRTVGLLVLSGRPPGAGALDALGGVVAIAIERAHFLEELKAAELARQGEELKSALLASIAHDLRTPLTAIRVAASNLQASWLTDADRREQSELVLAEVGRLSRLFENILEMARIDAGTIAATQRWVHPSEIVEAARDQVGQALQGHRLDVDIRADMLVRLDPRLTAAALAHLLENAVQYAPVGGTITVTADVSTDGLEISVRDRGPGIALADLPHLFERFYRGADAKQHASGTGMGLSIARGLLAAEQGRVWGENTPEGGARFTIVVPAETKPSAAESLSMSS
jgi:two-component system, OmpR family, sensor histidine kinase KdpD